MAKGAGMIEPNMATMIGLLTTDAQVSPAILRKALEVVGARYVQRNNGRRRMLHERYAVRPGIRRQRRGHRRRDVSGITRRIACRVARACCRHRARRRGRHKARRHHCRRRANDRRGTSGRAGPSRIRLSSRPPSTAQTLTGAASWLRQDDQASLSTSMPSPSTWAARCCSRMAGRMTTWRPSLRSISRARRFRST